MTDGFDGFPKIKDTIETSGFAKQPSDEGIYRIQSMIP